jgi:hypothetical protein
MILSYQGCGCEPSCLWHFIRSNKDMHFVLLARISVSNHCYWWAPGFQQDTTMSHMSACPGLMIGPVNLLGLTRLESLI